MSELVRLYYDNNVEREWLRLSDPYGRIEYSTTLHLIEKYFRRLVQLLILDVGQAGTLLSYSKKPMRQLSLNYLVSC